MAMAAALDLPLAAAAAKAPELTAAANVGSPVAAASSARVVAGGAASPAGAVVVPPGKVRSPGASARAKLPDRGAGARVRAGEPVGACVDSSMRLATRAS